MFVPFAYSTLFMGEIVPKERIPEEMRTWKNKEEDSKVN